MRQEENYINLESIDISVKEFDAMDERHIFSDKYKKNKKNMMREFRKRSIGSMKKNYAKIAIAAALVIVSTPVVVNAATDGELFNRIWGNSGRESIDSHDEEIFEEEKGTSYTVTYPKREYEEVDPEKAEELIGDNISFEPIEKQMGDTKLTILSSVSDGNAAVVEFTLEKEGGVDVIYNQLYNESKGPMFLDSATYSFYFKECGGNIYVDLDKSTDEKLYCYDYIVMNVFDNNKHPLTLEIIEYPCTKEEMYNADGGEYQRIMEETKTTTIPIAIKSEVETVEYVNNDGGSLQISPLSMKLDMQKGLGLSDADPYNIYYVSVSYKDGSNYIVHEHEMSELHTCDVDIDNVGYTCGDMENWNLTYVFNRLVDVGNIESITINESTYTVK